VTGVVMAPPAPGAKAWARVQLALPFQAPVVVLFAKSANEENNVTNSSSLHEQGLVLLDRVDQIDGPPALDVEQLHTEPVALAARWLTARTAAPACKGTTASSAADQLARAIGAGVGALDLVAAALALGLPVEVGDDGVQLGVATASPRAPGPPRVPVAASRPAPTPSATSTVDPAAWRERDAAHALGVSVGLLRKWRALDERAVALGRAPVNPPWKRLGGKAVVYPVTLVRKWLAARDGPATKAA